jgi:hypothetical protein
MEKYELSRQEFYESELSSVLKQIASLLDQGYIVEISQSRSGLKFYSIGKRLQNLKHLQNGEGR